MLATVPVEVAPAEGPVLGPGPHVLVVNTFSADEPLDEIMRAAARLPGVTFHVTGDLRRAARVLQGETPDNVRLTGWVSDPDYHGLLRGSDVVLCLTTRDHTMQHGGYEAMASRKPLVTSDWPLLREVFAAGTVHVDNSSEAIAAGLQRALDEREALSREMAVLGAQRDAAFRTAIAGLRQLA